MAESTMSSSSGDLAERVRQFMEARYGAGIWQRMWDLMVNNRTHKGSRWLWEFMNDDTVRCACVWTPGTTREQQSGPVTENEGSTWWPVLVSFDPESVQGELCPVLCLPLLENNCHTPWMTHASRILIMPVAVASPASSCPPAPPVPEASPASSCPPPPPVAKASPVVPPDPTVVPQTSVQAHPRHFEILD